MDFMDWVTRRLLGSTDEELIGEAVPEEVERLQHELLLAVEGFEDDEVMPVRMFMVGVAAQEGGALMSREEQMKLPQWETVGWFRGRVRAILASLAR